MITEATLISSLRDLRRFSANTIKVDPFGCCASPQPQDGLSDAEYTAYLAAADGKHDTYMRHNTPWAPTDLACQVTAGGKVIAWITYDGQVHVSEGVLTSRAFNHARELARTHLGASPQTQQNLADERADVERMSAEAFRSVIGDHLKRSEPGSCFNDFPTDTPVRVWMQRRRAATGQWPANPTVPYTDVQRAVWARTAADYASAFRARFPHDFRLWMCEQHLISQPQERSEPLELQPGDRVAVRAGRKVEPAVVVAVKAGGVCRAVVRVEDGSTCEIRHPCHHRGVVRADELLPEARFLFGGAWARIAAAAD